ncbi:hypothetical protein AAVH_32029, partial [Aphelenchoides avenae]
VGVEVLGWIGAVLNALSLTGAVITRSIKSTVGGIFGLLFYLGLIIAKRKNSHRWYLPIMALNALYLALEVILSILSLIVLLTAHNDASQLTTSWGGMSLRGARFEIMVVMLMLPIARTSFAQHVVSRAYKCLKRESEPTTVA